MKDLRRYRVRNNRNDYPRQIYSKKVLRPISNRYRRRHRNKDDYYFITIRQATGEVCSFNYSKKTMINDLLYDIQWKLNIRCFKLYKEGLETDIDSAFPRNLAIYLGHDTNQSLFLIPTEEPQHNQMTHDVCMYNVIENSNITPRIKCEDARNKKNDKYNSTQLNIRKLQNIFKSIKMLLNINIKIE